MEIADRYSLPPKPDAKPYSLREMLAYARPFTTGIFAGDDAQTLSCLEQAYHHSHRFALALERLGQQVALAVRSDNFRPKELFPQSEREYFSALDEASRSAEIVYDPTRAAQSGARHPRAAKLMQIREAQNDPLAMARKHAIDVLAPNPQTMPRLHRIAKQVYETVAFHDNMERHEAAWEVQNIMMLMADNAVNHGGLQQAAAKR